MAKSTVTIFESHRNNRNNNKKNTNEENNHRESNKRVNNNQENEEYNKTETMEINEDPFRESDGETIGDDLRHNFNSNRSMRRRTPISWYPPARQIVLAPFRIVLAILRDGRHPPHVSMILMRNYLILFGLWPSRGQRTSSIMYRISNVCIMLLLSVFALTITCDLYDASSDILLFGDDLVVLLGLYLILLKIWLYRNGSAAIEDILGELNALHDRYAHHPIENPRIRRMQRHFFLGEIGSFTSYLILVAFFSTAICVQPLFGDQLLPYHAKFPLGLHDPQLHPTAHAVIYIYQCVCTIYNLLAIIFIDNLGCHTFSQTTLNLRILALRIRHMCVAGDVCEEDAMLARLRIIVEDHQHIIGLIDKINRFFYSNYVAQMSASTFIICLTAFEALLAKDQPMVAFKFQIYMLSALTQLFYWCWMGNMVYFDSQEIATAAFDISRWYEQSPRFQRNLMFLIQRAQQPLVFRAKPFYAFEFQSFSSILSTSYSYFALLRTMND